MSINDSQSALLPPAEALLQQELNEHRRVFEATALMLARPFVEALDILDRAVRSGGKLLLFGNGGSAADAQHIAAELIVRYQADRAAISAIALTTDTSTLTACGNDMGFDALFERQIEALGRKGDAAVAISTSGNSANVLRGLDRARAMGLKTVGLTGGTGGKMRSACDAVIVVPSTVTARIQELHGLIGHMLCKALEQRLGLVAAGP
ncbi:MAG TPA: SIS domain-containing protein [Steroidobacteraceae bacterium]|jgi:D-sedoheptulose 7-phosphate isomerase